MAKKRVHEIAKERGISSKEVLAVLQKAGLDVKAAASSVDEDDIARAFSNGAESAAAEQPKAEAAPAGDGAQAREKSAPRQPEQAGQQPQQGDGGQRPQRPQRRPEQGGGAGGRRRRVVIDSQASRRPQGPPPVQQPPRRGRGRRRRTPWVEPDLTAQPEPQQEEPATQINSGATVKEVAESLGLGASEVIKKLMELGEMATLTQTLSDEAIGVLADEFDKKIEITHAADEVAEEPEYAEADEVPIMIAVNKIDKEGADPNRVRGELAQLALTPADWGGDTEFVDVSAKTKVGLEDLLETVVTIAELEELKANPNTEASGSVIESKLDPGRGPVVTLLVQRGTLKVGDALLAGAHWARVRAMNDYRGQRRNPARPGDPVEILGFDGVPEAGEHFRVVENDRRARQLAGERANRLKTEALALRHGVRVSLEDVFARAQEGINEINLVLKADVAGSLEALEDEIAKLPHDQVAVNVIHDGVGGINESDVMLASASDAIVIGFNVRPVQDAAQIAAREGVEIRTYTVIYRVVEELRAAMEGMLEPEEVESTIGVAEVRATFRASRIGTIAGSFVREGTIRRGASCRLVRGGTIIYDGRIGSLRRFQDDVREVETGFECGIVLENFPDVKEEDVIEVYETRQVEREL